MAIEEKYDVIVVGGGHAGCEAACAAAKLGAKTLLISMNINLFAAMSCNPAIGGIAKGQIVREIDALGGMTGIIADKSMIQFRMLNLSKGPAMWSPRSQNDKYRFSEEWKKVLTKTPNLLLREDCVTSLQVDSGCVTGVTTKLGKRYEANAVILTNGTFLNGIIHVGEVNFSGGRIGEQAAFNLTENLRKIGFESDRLKTGTPVRIDGRSIDFDQMEEQKGDEKINGFSFLNIKHPLKQKSCWITYTNKTVHDILRKGFDASPMFQGRIKGVGPRYCPSIEDKIERFSGKEQHQLFLEPENEDGIEYYLNGFSSSLPEEIQVEAMHHIKGLEHAQIIRPGYAIEYDYFPPTQLKPTLETKLVQNLYFAGQINGTTGYEEAACQGLMAGINATKKISGKESLVLHRDEAYIGVLIDDLTSKGVDEPYRMFTSRAEHRILLRQDNADLRLTPIGYQIGLISEGRYNLLLKKQKEIEQLVTLLQETSVQPQQINPFLEKVPSSPIQQKTKADQLLSRPEISIEMLKEAIPELKDNVQKIQNRIDTNSTENQSNETKYEQDLIVGQIWKEAETLIKYSNYIKKEKETAEKMHYLENIKLNPDFDYFSIPSLSTEARQKLSRIKPSSLGQASRISGVSPSDISVLMVLLGR